MKDRVSNYVVKCAYSGSTLLGERVDGQWLAHPYGFGLLERGDMVVAGRLGRNAEPCRFGTISSDGAENRCVRRLSEWLA